MFLKKSSQKMPKFKLGNKRQNNLMITLKPHAHFQTLPKPHAKFQKNRLKLQEELHLQATQCLCTLIEGESEMTKLKLREEGP